MIISMWLDLPRWLNVLTLVAVYFASGALLVWLSFGSLTRARAVRLKGVVAPFFGSTALIFGLLVSFVANDVWDRTDRAYRTVLAERDALVTLYDLDYYSGDPVPGLEQALMTYVRAVVYREWPDMARGEASSSAQVALEAMLHLVANRSSASNSTAVDKAMLDAALKVRAARDERLVLNADTTQSTKWWAVILLALITQVGIAVVHLESIAPQVAAIAIFTAGVITVLGLVAAHESPFRPPIRVTPEPIVRILEKEPLLRRH